MALLLQNCGDVCIKNWIILCIVYMHCALEKGLMASKENMTFSTAVL